MDLPQPSLTPYAPGQQPARSDQVSQHLGAIAARLTDRGISSRLSRLGDTPVLTIEEPAAGPNAATVSVDPDTSNDHGLSIDCTCLWTPAPGTGPEATADTIITVLKAISRGTDVAFGDDMPSGLSAPHPPHPSASLSVMTWHHASSGPCIVSLIYVPLVTLTPWLPRASPATPDTA
jgi:hypothetical protein